MNEKEWLIEFIENFISDMSDFNGDNIKLIPIVKSLIVCLEEYINLIKNSGV